MKTIKKMDIDIATVTLSTLLGRIEQLESLVQELVKFTNYSQNTTIPPSPQQSCYLGNISQTNNGNYFNKISYP